MFLKPIFSQNEFWQLSDSLSKELGAVEFSVLSNLFVRRFDLESSGVIVNRWFFKNQKSISEDLGIGVKRVVKAIKSLESKGIILTKLSGVPARKHYKINDSAILEAINLKNK